MQAASAVASGEGPWGLFLARGCIPKGRQPPRLRDQRQSSQAQLRGARVSWRREGAAGACRESGSHGSCSGDSRAHLAWSRAPSGRHPFPTLNFQATGQCFEGLAGPTSATMKTNSFSRFQTPVIHCHCQVPKPWPHERQMDPDRQDLTPRRQAGQPTTPEFSKHLLT